MISLDAVKGCPLTPIQIEDQDVNDQLPWVTHEGKIEAFGKTLRVYQLSD